MLLQKVQEGQRIHKKLVGKDKKMSAKVYRTQKENRLQKKSLKQVKWLQQEESGYLEADENEEQLHFRQKHLKQLVPLQTKSRIFELFLDFGPYTLDYHRNGNFLLLGGQKGHIAMLKWKTKDIVCEFNVKERIRDVKFLQTQNFFAVAQTQHVYIYDSQGIELHRLEQHHEPVFLEYLPYHFIMAALSKGGYLIYQDITTGEIVSEIKTGVREATAMVQNPYNGIILTGSQKGTVSMWNPNIGKPVVKILAHNGAVKCIQANQSGHYLATTGSDELMKIWDVRTYKQLYQYWIPAQPHSLAMSQSNLLAVSYSDQVMI